MTKIYSIADHFQEFNSWNYRQGLSDDEKIVYDRTALAMLIREKKEEKDFADATGPAKIRLIIQMMNKGKYDD